MSFVRGRMIACFFKSLTVRMLPWLPQLLYHLPSVEGKQVLAGFVTQTLWLELARRPLLLGRPPSRSPRGVVAERRRPFHRDAVGLVGFKA